MKKYDNYKDSGIEWIGEIPEHWISIPMRFLLRQKITDGPHETPQFIAEGIPFLSVDGIQNGELVFEGCRKISEEDHSRYKQKCVVEKQDILMGKAASVGKVAQVKVDFEFSIWSPLALLKPNHNKITSAYFEYFLKSTYAKDNANILSTFNTQQNISMTDIPRIYYIIPNSIEEQTAIAHYLDRKTAEIDELIADKKRLLELYNEEKTAIINQAVTKGINPNVPMKDTGIEWLGEIPEHWEVKRFKYYFELITEKLEEDLPKIGLENIESKSGKFIETDSDFAGQGIRFKPKDILFGKLRPYLAKVWLADFDGQAVGDFYVFRSNNTVHPAFAQYRILDSSFIEVTNNSTYGSKMPRVNWEFIADLPIAFPNAQEQKTIVHHIETECTHIDSKIQATKKLIDLLTEYRTALISEVVTGKIKVT